MAKYGFDLQRKNKNKKNVVLIALFICFVIVLGTVSTFLLWRSLNYDFNNIFNKTDEESTTTVETTEKTDDAVFRGNALFLVAVTSDDGKQTRFINLIGVDLGEKTVRVIPFDHSRKSESADITYGKLLGDKGITELVSSVETDFRVDIDKYAVALKSGGMLILSGFYTQDVPMIEQSANNCGLTLISVAEKKNWANMCLVKE